MKKDIMILYSGGVESTALVVHALKQEHNITLIHVIHNNKSQKEHTACRGTSYKHFGNLPVLAITIQKNNFDLNRDPNSSLPFVRTDINKYLVEGDSGIDSLFFERRTYREFPAGSMTVADRELP